MGVWKIYFVTVVILANFLHKAHGQKININDVKYKKQREIVIENVSDMSVFYSLRDNSTIKDMMPRPWYTPGQSLKLPFIGEPCACKNLQCGCCAGIRFEQLGFDKKACANITYDPFLFALILDVYLNNVNVVHQVISAKNPPAVCYPVPIGIPGVELCVKIFDIYTPEVRNIHFCMDWELRILSQPILILHFDCLKIGYDGIAIVKPDSPTVLGSPEEANIEPTQTNGEIYDEVTEIKENLATEDPNVIKNMTNVLDYNITINNNIENDPMAMQNEIKPQ